MTFLESKTKVFGWDDYNSPLDDWRGSISAPVSLDEWFHVAYVDSGNTLSLYLDGVLFGTEDMNPGATWQNSQDYLYLGWAPNVNGQVDSWTTAPGGATLDGRLDDFRIYNRVLNESEIQQLASIPEPTTAALFFTGLAGFLFRRQVL